MTEDSTTAHYFPHCIQIDARHWSDLKLGPLSRQIVDHSIPDIIFYRQLALRLNRTKVDGAPPVHAGHLNMYATLLKVYRHLIDVVADQQAHNVLDDALKRSGHNPTEDGLQRTEECFVGLFPPSGISSDEARQWLHAGGSTALHQHLVLREMLLLHLASRNPALDSFRKILDDRHLTSAAPPYRRIVSDMTVALTRGPLLPDLDMTLADALLAPILASPDSLSGQVGYIREHWNILLPEKLFEEILIAFDIVLEEERSWGGAGEPGPPPVMEFGRMVGGAAGGGTGEFGSNDGSSVFGGYEYPEYEQFSTDADWMSNVVLMAKMVYVWLHQLSQTYERPITRLDQILDAELDRLAAGGFTGLWLIGIWERSPASQRIKQLCGNPEAIASAYSLYDYEIAHDLGGWEALHNLKSRAMQRGIRLASDMVPNHTGIYSRWVLQHPDWFVQTDYPPFPTYQFNGEDLSHSGDVVIQVEDGYWTKTDAAVVFRLIERTTGRIRYIYHGNDGTSIPWNDTAQLNYLIPEVREAVIQTILHVARSFPIIRFDAAMTLAKKHFQRLWYPVKGLGGGIPSRASHGMSRDEFDAVFPVEFWREVVDRVAAEVPGTLLLAEAFWLMEGYFVRTLGMHRVYNSAFMNMLKQEENAKYRQTIKNVLEFNPEVLKRFVNFMNNPDEKTAVEQFGREGKYFGACVLLATMPGLPMFGHGQIEGFHEKYGMEYKQSYWNEQPDGHLIWLHEQRIFPLLRCRGLFSGSEHFALYDFFAGESVNEDVYAYSNRLGEQRGLVLYHNRYATTSGWIRESVARASGFEGDPPELQRTTLAVALGMVNDRQVYYSFRDHTLGLVFIRSSSELHEKGLYAELGEYEFHVFTDFRELRDDAAGSWGNLCSALNGRGVTSLQDELTQLRHPELNAAYRNLLETEIPQKISPASLKKSLHSAAKLFLETLSKQINTPAVQNRAVLERLTNNLSAVQTLKISRPSVKTTRETLVSILDLLESPIGLRITMTWSLLEGRVTTTRPHGLDYTLLQLVTLADSVDRQRAVFLLETLLSVVQTGGEGLAAATKRAFSTKAGREFLQIHTSGGTEWFNKECFEELLKWLLALEILEYAASAPTPRALALRLGTRATEYGRLTACANLSGYRSALLQQSLAAQAAPTKVAASDSSSQEPARKNHAQNPARTKTAKASHNKIPR